MATAQTRIEELLEATCRAVARSGAHRLTMSEVAREAGVSTALLHYYFETKTELLTRAFEYAEERMRELVDAELATLERADDRIDRLLLIYVRNDAVSRENWVLWNELWSSALFDPELRPAIEAAYRAWVARLEALLEEAVSRGELPSRINPAESAARLAAVVDGLGSQVVLDMIDPNDAGLLVRRAFGLEREGA